MKIWAIADLHLCFGAPDKSMELFGPIWKDYTKKIQTHWVANVKEEDLVLIAGDISWAMHLEQAQKDLDFIQNLPGTKVMIKGNHDYWWGSYSKVKKSLPPSIHAIQNNAFTYKHITIGGTRLWDSKDINCTSLFTAPYTRVSSAEDEKIYLRELERLRLSLSQLDPHASIRIAMTHYPPISFDLSESMVSKILEEFRVDVCVFGHLHNLQSSTPFFGKKNEVQYYLTAADFLNFTPQEIVFSSI